MITYKYFDQPTIKRVGEVEGGVVLRALITPYGSPQRKDLHGDFFTPDTYFGDDVIQRKFGLYEHFVNDLNNPVMKQMGKINQILGPAVLVKAEDLTDEEVAAGRWFDMEVRRSIPYFDALMELVDQKLMGASTQAFYNSVERKSNGELTVWVENEVSVTPTPAHPKTLGRVEEAMDIIAKYDHLPALGFVSGNGVVDLTQHTLKTWQENLKTEGVTDLNVEEPLVANDDDGAPNDVDVLEEINDIFDEDADDVPVIEALSEDAQKAIRAIVAQEVKASMSVFIELWGTDIEEAREAVLSMMSGAKAAQDLKTDMVKMAKAFVVFSRGIKTMMAKSNLEVAQEYLQMTAEEKQLAQELDANPDTVRPIRKSGVPAGAPGTS